MNYSTFIKEKLVSLINEMDQYYSAYYGVKNSRNTKSPV